MAAGLRRLRCVRVGEPAEFAMFHPQQHSLPAIHSLAAHLDAALVACEDLRRITRPAADPHNALRLELTAITHVLQARHDATEIRFADRELADRAGLFVSGTDPLETASAAARDRREEPGAVDVIGGCMSIASLEELLACLLGALEACLVLPDGPDAADLPPSRAAVPETAVWATGTDGG
jgi:hypothetical protein